MKNIGEIIDILQHTETVFCRLPGVGDYELCTTRELNEIIIPEPRQLTLDELKQMDGQPVWVDDIKSWAIIVCDTAGHWAGVPFAKGSAFEYNIDVRSLKCYDRPPGGDRP